MTRAAAILISMLVLAVVWTVVMWGMIYIGDLFYPDNLHNAISLSGAIAVGPFAGIVAAVFTYRRSTK
jgi:hypothetical protein